MRLTRLFYRLIVRPMLGEPVRTALAVLAVGLGVAVVVAIELAGSAAVGSFRASVESLTGDQGLEVTAVGGVPDAVVGRLAVLPYPIEVRPRIEGFATDPASRRTFPVIGLDLVGQAGAIGASRDDGANPWTEDGIWLTRGFGLAPGRSIELVINDRRKRLEVRGLLDPGASASAGGDVAVIDIADAQRLYRRTGIVDRVVVSVPDRPSLDEWAARLRPLLPPGVNVQPLGSGTEGNRRMLAAFRANLRVLSYVALVVGAFLIYNTISVSVVRRRAEIGIVRALGASRVMVLTAFLGEAAALGVAGGLVGVGLGRAMAGGAVRLLSSTVESLYVSSTPGRIEVTGWTILLALVIGTVVSIVAALSPAREASFVAPVEAMARGRRDYLARVHERRDLVMAVILALAGGLLSRQPALDGRPLFGYLSALALIGAATLATPALVLVVTRLSSHWLRRLLGIVALLASRSLAGSLRRTSVLVGALATAIAMMTAVGIMVGSFRQTVITWLDAQLPADLYIRPAGSAASDRHPTLDPELPDLLERVAGVAAVDRFRAYEVTVNGLTATFASADARVGAGFRRPTLLSGRPPDAVLRELQQPGTALVSEPFANKHGVRAGDLLTLTVGGGPFPLRVLDIYYDYASERGYILVNRETMLSRLPDRAVSNVAIYLEEGADPAAVRREVERVAAGREVLVITNRDLRREAVKIFDRTFAITYALEAVAIVVAVVGIAGALLALVIDRRRELGLLRFLGASVGQVRRLILVEAGLIGLLANIAGVLLGVALSFILIFVINKQSFGWTIRLHWPVGVLTGALSLVYAATVLAGLYPARVAARLDPIEVIHEE